MIAKEFPDNVATMFAILETFFGIGKYKELTFDFVYIFVYNLLGMIMGPTVGGALYEAGGFTLPFVTLGGVLFLAALFCWVVLPSST